MIILQILFIICIVAILFITFITFIGWMTHLEMLRSDCAEYKFPILNGKFKDFREQMAKHKWERDINHPTSFFQTSGMKYDEWLKNYVHASIIRFDGIGMRLINPIDYLLFEIWLLKHKYKLPVPNKLKDIKSWLDLK